MKKGTKYVLALVLVCCSSAVLKADQPLPAAGLRNGGFEAAIRPDGHPDGWRIYGTSLSGGSVCVTDKRAFEGKKSLRIEDKNSSKPVGMESLYSPAVAGEKYRAGCRIYNEAGKGWLYLQFYDRNRRRVGEVHVKSSGIGKWEKLTAVGVCPPEAEYVAVCVYLAIRRVGVSYFDAVTLDGKLSPASVEKMLKDGVNLFAADVPDAAYPRVEQGQLRVNGKRLRLWGSQGGFGSDPRKIDREVLRFRKTGFNLFRPINLGSIPDYDYTPGDGSRMDYEDYSFAAMARSGGYLWLDMMNAFRITPRDVDLTEDPAISRKEWLTAITKLSSINKNHALFRTSRGLMYWDLRSRAAYMRYLDMIMTHRNPYTGLTYAEDPSIAVIELMNEQWWVPRALGGAKFKGLPKPLLRSLLIRWNRWLKEKYGSAEALQKAWGKLLPIESLEKQTVMLQPLMGSAAADKMSHALGIDDDFDEKAKVAVPESKQRGEDVIKFLMDIHLDFCKEAVARIRSHGKPNRGAAVVPVVIDTGCNFCMQSQYEHSVGAGSALSCATYVHQFDTNKNRPTYPWLAALRKPPHFNNWVDQNRLENKPTFLYELMFFAPGKYRGDFALRLLGMASIQDLDVVDWHFYNPYHEVTSKNPLRMPTTDHYWNGVSYSNDEVAMATMMLASTIFRHGDVRPPAKPTVLVIGKDMLYDKKSLHWGKFRKALCPTVFRHGLRLRFDPEQETSGFIGPDTGGKTVPDIVSPTGQISYHWKKGYMVIESPRVRMVAGFLPKKFDFACGDTLENISVHNPKGTPYVIDGERFVCFAMCSRDAKPLEQSNDIIATAVSTSWNTGFEFDMKKWEALQAKSCNPPGNAAKCVKRGTLPINVCRVEWTLNAPWLKGMRAKCNDFDFNVFRDEKITGTKLSISSDEKLFIVELTR